MMEKGKMERGVVELVDTESLVPQEHLLRKVDRAVEFRKLYEIVEPLYSEEEGRTSIDPVVLFKIVLLQHLDGIPSLRGTLRRAQTDIAYRWFLGYTLNEELPHFSTVSYNFRHRFTEETIERVFQWVLNEAGTAGALHHRSVPGRYKAPWAVLPTLPPACVDGRTPSDTHHLAWAAPAQRKERLALSRSPPAAPFLHLSSHGTDGWGSR